MDHGVVAISSGKQDIHRIDQQEPGTGVQPDAVVMMKMKAIPKIIIWICVIGDASLR